MCTGVKFQKKLPKIKFSIQIESLYFKNISFVDYIVHSGQVSEKVSQNIQ
jgi:hypothetical protein